MVLLEKNASFTFANNLILYLDTMFLIGGSCELACFKLKSDALARTPLKAVESVSICFLFTKGELLNIMS